MASLCDYCHQKPKFAPYNYCSKACGSRAKATGSTHSNGPVMCKQCGQRPVYQGHQFCGRNCANTWQAMYGQINTGWNGQPQYGHQQLWKSTMPPPQAQNPPNPTQPHQGLSQGGGIQGIVKGLKDLVSQPQPPQQQQQPGPPNPPYVQQVSGPISPNPQMISPPITPMSSGMGSPMSPGMSGPMLPGTFSPMSPGTPTPTAPGLNQQYYNASTPTSPWIQDPNADNQTNGQHFSSPHFPVPSAPKQSKAMKMAMSPPTYSANDDTQLDYDPDDFDPDEDPNQDPTMTLNHTGGPIPIQARIQIQVSSLPMGAGGHGNQNWNPSDPNNFPPQRVTSTSTPSGSFATCRLKGCDKPIYVDPATHHQSEYCSQRHREDAAIFGQVSPCIMCLKMPRSSDDYFCSRACREKALSP
ncbi:hypothetical protein BDM02DRAFT_3191258 [Thelephora ganbajun]|uniref:Uncharacterized protein n=1 Tax=Thelephora ganbajun TaxID=370292 RepID=A0ACB6Z2C3_THEGA|nr:hypothetical protein BDM02DRAFT_3191258 [Thelephora ganbajun]